MKTKFTEGKWKWLIYNSINAFIFNEMTGLRIAHVNQWSVKSEKELIANAKLIASAPELLETALTLWKTTQQSIQYLPEDKKEVYEGVLDFTKKVIEKAIK